MSAVHEPVRLGTSEVLPVRSRHGAVFGAYILGENGVRWEPAFNLNAAVMWGCLCGLALAAVGLAVLRRIPQKPRRG